MRRQRLVQIGVALAVACGLADFAPTIALAVQNDHQFNQTWLMLGPYYRKNLGGAPGVSAIRADYLTDGPVTQSNLIPTAGGEINTNYALPQCGSVSFVWGTRANGFTRPTVFAYTSPSDRINLSDSVFNHPSDGRLDNTVVYAWVYANNLTSGPITDARLGVDSDDSIEVVVNGVERLVFNGTRSLAGAANYVATVSDPFTLGPGLNLVMVKVFNGSGGFGFRCRMQDSDQRGVNQAAGIPASQVVWQTVGTYSYPPIPPPPNSAAACRTIHTYLGYTPGAPVQVDVTATTTSGHPGNVFLSEFPPFGWTFGTPSATLGTASVLTTTTAGGYTGPYIRWNVGPMSLATTNTAVMTYSLTPPLGPSLNAICTGTVWSDSQRVVGRDAYLPAPTPSVGMFEWAGSIGRYPIGGVAGRPAVPPVTSGTVLIGDPRCFGSASFDGTSYTITASGSDIWGTDDRGYVLAKRVTGDFILSADVVWTSLTTDATGAGRHCKAGLMVRESLSPGAVGSLTGLKNYYNYQTSPTLPISQKPFFHQWRNVAWQECGHGGEEAVTTQTGGVIIPSRFKLVRRGNIVESYGFYGGQWRRHPGAGIRTVTGLTTRPVLACLAVTSHVNGSSVTAQFTNVSIAPVPLVSATRSLLSQDVDMLGNPAYTSKTITVRIFLKNGGTSTPIMVRDFAPTSWTIRSAQPPAVVQGTTITWNIPHFSTDTTLTYEIQPPGPNPLPNPWPVEPQFFGEGFVEDQLNHLNCPITGPNMMLGARVEPFQQGVFPAPTYAGTTDVHIIQSNGGLRNTGWSNVLEEGDGGNGRNDNRTMLLRFDLSSLEPSYTIYGAKLLLRHVGNRTPITSGTGHTIYAARITGSWGEGCGATYPDGRPANLGEANWQWAKYAEVPWVSGGLRGGEADCEMPESFAVATTSTVGTWVAWDVARMVNRWVKSPSTNFGIKLSQDDMNTTHYPTASGYRGGILQFASRNHENPNWRPILAIVAYRPP
jgi:hypothetical protein